jgi:hypothetical protein
MNSPLGRRVDRLERARVAGRRTRFLFVEEDETQAQLQARIRAMIASGEAGRNDRIIPFAWRSPGHDGPEN